MIETIAASKEVFVYSAACSHYISGTIDLLIIRVGCCSTREEWTCVEMNTSASHIATDVATAIDSTHMTVCHLDPCAVIHIAHLASTVEIVYYYIGTVHLYMGTIFHLIVINTKGTAVTVIGNHGKHVACITSTVDSADATACQGEGGQTCHVGLIVTAKECANIVYASAIPCICLFDGNAVAYRIGVDGIGENTAIGVARPSGQRAVDRYRSGTHIGCVATSEKGVALATVDGNVHLLALHFVAAAEEVSDAELTSYLMTGVVTHCSLCLGVVDHNVFG